MGGTRQKIASFFGSRENASKILFWVFAILVSLFPCLTDTFVYAVTEQISFFDISKWFELISHFLRTSGLIWTLFVMCLLCAIEYAVLGMGRQREGSDRSSIILITFIVSFIFSFAYAGTFVYNLSIPLPVVGLTMIVLLVLSFFTQMTLFEKE